MRPRARVVVIVGVLLALAECAVRLRWVSPAVFASPTEIAVATIDLLKAGILRDVGATAWRAVGGVAIGFPLGVLVALSLYLLHPSDRRLGVATLDFVRSIPLTAMVPLFVAILGVGELNKVALSAVAATLVTAIASWAGLRHAMAEHAVLFALYEPPEWKRVVLALVPSAAPAVGAGLRLAVSTALVLVVVAEMTIGTRTGIGRAISDAQYGDGVARQYALLLLAGLLGWGLNLLAGWMGPRWLGGATRSPPAE